MRVQASSAREHLAEVQRTRILSAMMGVVSERGLGYATVARVVARSGVSRRTFYEQFEDREDCFLMAFDQAVERIASIVVPAYAAPSRWRERIRHGLSALLECFDAEHSVARLVVVESLGSGPRGLERRRQVLSRAVAAVEEGRSEVRSGEGPPPLTAEGLVGGVFALIHQRMVDQDAAPLIELLNPLVSMIVLPYLGHAVARKELDQVVPTPRSSVSNVEVDPLRGLDMRLTYRTVRVLLAVGTHAGASNRQIADGAGIRDQGQISKLLSRLQDLGLIRNSGDPRAKGEPNSWALTAKGLDVQAALVPRTPSA